MTKFDHPNFDIRHDTNDDVKKLFLSARQRKERNIRYKLISELLAGQTIDVTKSSQLYEALNREKMEFDEILKNNPEQVKECIEYVKERKAQQGGRWYNPESQAWWGEKGVVPPCCYFARPSEYWNDKKLMNNFLNTYSKFRIAEHPL